MLINKDNLSIQQKYSFIEDVKLNKSGNVSESPPSGYGDCATHLNNNIHEKKFEMVNFRRSTARVSRHHGKIKPSKARI